MSIARVALPVAASRLFDYWVPAGVDVGPGAIVKVALGQRRLAGVVTELVSEASVSPDKLLAVDEVVSLPPLPDDICDLCAFVATYYQAPLGLAFALAVPPLRPGRSRHRERTVSIALSAAGRTSLPATLRRSPVARELFARLEPERAVLESAAIATLPARARRILRSWLDRGFVQPARASCPEGVQLRLNAAQQRAVDAIVNARGGFSPFLLDGVTGSGKTEVYLAAAAHSVAMGGQVLMLVPEINLTPQLVERVKLALPGARTVSLHSGMAEGERLEGWREAALGRADIVLGTRLAIFTPMPRLDLVVIDEEHDGSYKQQDTVRYHARDAALWRGRRRSVRVVLGSATPSLESHANADAGRYQRLILDRRADARASPPAVHFVPARGDDVREGLSIRLWDALAERLRRGEQSLVFVNRRGFAPALKCAACAWEAGCPRCSARLVAHRVPPGLVCHHCGHRERLPRACAQCGNVDLAPAGHGTQRLELALAATFAGARIARVDRDTTQRRSAFDEVRLRVAANEVDILVGTQMLAKGHDFPRLTLVGVLGADNALYSADFRATERLAALLVQVAGRAGRAELPGEVVVQTDFPDHPLYASLARHDHASFARALMHERQASGLPPFTHLALLTAEAHDRDDADAFLASAFGEAIEQRCATCVQVEVFHPVPAAMARRAGLERSQMLLRSAQRGDLNRLLTALRQRLEAHASRKVRWAIDVDPPGLA